MRNSLASRYDGPVDLGRDQFAGRLLAWYDRHRRDLPWRAPLGRSDRLDPYAVLVSELMLQQTQVATVIPYFNRFMARFPTAELLARADEQEVLRLWQGLGYYSRARNLQAAARKIVSDHGGQIPASLEEISALPGVGRYTAGAVASIAFEISAPIVDGNVARVLCRLEQIERDPRQPEIQKTLWQRAQAMLPDRRIGDFNSALMELGATVCVPGSPRCLLCPVRDFCKAAASGAQEQIPPPRKTSPTPLVRRWTLCLGQGDRWLLERREARGRWAGMWQFLTWPAGGKAAAAEAFSQLLGAPIVGLTRLGEIRHALTHRKYEFEIFRARLPEKIEIGAARRWVALDEIDELPLPSPHLKIRDILIDPAVSQSLRTRERGRRCGARGSRQAARESAAR